MADREINKIVYGGRTFYQDSIKNGNMHLAASLLSEQLEVNTLEFDLVSDDTSLTSFIRNDKLAYFYGGNQTAIFYLQNVERTGPRMYYFAANSAIGLLMEGLHYGGIYTGQTVEEVLPGIMGAVPYYIKSNLKPIKLYGWLPVAAPRDNLSQVLFAIGATVKTDLDGYLRIESFWDSVSSITGKDRIYSGAKVGYTPAVTQVVVTEHQYVESAESMQLFEGTTAAGDIVTFNEPIHGLTASGFAVLDSGANWARLSAGSGTLTGLKYTHNTRQITKNVAEAQVPNIKKVESATLISLVNSQATAERLANYYKWLETVDAAVVYRGEKPGDRVQVWHPYDNTDTTACLQSADVTLSNVLKAQEKALVGYVPPLPEQQTTYDNRIVLSGSGTWNVPEGVTTMRAVLIGGGQGGQGGYSGESGEDGSDASPVRGTYSAGTPGTGGKGGEKGSGGMGGNVLIADISIPQGVTNIKYNCGTGGAGGASGGGIGARGTDTSIQIGGGSYSSADGGSSGLGYTDLQTGETYAINGKVGVNGADGGDGSQYTGATAPFENYNGCDGKPVEDWQGGWGGWAQFEMWSNGVIDESGASAGMITLNENYRDGKQQLIVNLPFTLAGGESYTYTNGQYKLNGNKAITITNESLGFGDAEILIDNIYILLKPKTSTSAGIGLGTEMLKFVRAKRYEENKAVLSYVYYSVIPSSPLNTYFPVVYGNGGRGGGGAAYNASAVYEGESSWNPGYASYASGIGANALPPVQITGYGDGGNGGNGGGGGGGGGAGYVYISQYFKYSISNLIGIGTSGGAGGAGSPGGTGGPGCVILYYGIPHVTTSGWLKTRDGKFFNGRLRRRFIV